MDQNKKKGAVEIRLNNQLYRCTVDEKWYNAEEKQPYAVALIAGVEPVQPEKNRIQPPGQRQWAITGMATIICEDCFKTKGFKEPSQVAKAQFDIKATSQKL